MHMYSCSKHCWIMGVTQGNGVVSRGLTRGRPPSWHASRQRVRGWRPPTSMCCLPILDAPCSVRELTHWRRDQRELRRGLRGQRERRQECGRRGKAKTRVG